jgi:hypothetical protein
MLTTYYTLSKNTPLPQRVPLSSLSKGLLCKTQTILANNLVIPRGLGMIKMISQIVER